MVSLCHLGDGRKLNQVTVLGIWDHSVCAGRWQRGTVLCNSPRLHTAPQLPAGAGRSPWAGSKAKAFTLGCLQLPARPWVSTDMG